MTVLITGARGGIGRACIEEFASRGTDIIAHARNRTDEFESYLSDIREKYKISVTPVYFDMTNIIEMKTSVKSLLKDNSVDILINNASVGHGGLFQMTTIDSIREVFENNLFSHMQITQLLLRQMVRNGSGVIINVASTAGVYLRPGNSAYGTSKAALIAWTKTLAYEVGPLGIRVNAVVPGFVNTKMVSDVKNTSVEDISRRNVLGKIAEPSDIAKTIVFLSSDEAAFINAETITVDGGGSKNNLDGSEY